MYSTLRQKSETEKAKTKREITLHHNNHLTQPTISSRITGTTRIVSTAAPSRALHMARQTTKRKSQHRKEGKAQAAEKGVALSTAPVHLAGPLLDDEVGALADGSGLLRKGLGRSGVGLGLEVVLIVRHGERGGRDHESKRRRSTRTGESDRARHPEHNTPPRAASRNGTRRERNGSGRGLLHKTPHARHKRPRFSCGPGLSGHREPVRSPPRRPRCAHPD